MVDENTGKPENGALPEFLDPATGGSDDANPNLDEIESILSNAEYDSNDVLEDLPDDEEYDAGAVVKTSLSGLILVVVALGLLVVGVLVIAMTPGYQKDLEHYFKGDIAKYKVQDKKALEEVWAEENLKAQTLCGDMSMKYLPRDANVTISQEWASKTVLEEDPKVGEWTKGDAKQTKTVAGMGVEELTSKAMPLQQSDADPGTGEITDTKVFRYKVTVEREGWKPYEMQLVEGRWEQTGSGAYVYPSQDINLKPNLETIKGDMLERLYRIEQTNLNEKTEKDKFDKESGATDLANKLGDLMKEIRLRKEKGRDVKTLEAKRDTMRKDLDKQNAAWKEKWKAFGFERERNAIQLVSPIAEPQQFEKLKEEFEKGALWSSSSFQSLYRSALCMSHKHPCGGGQACSLLPAEDCQAKSFDEFLTLLQETPETWTSSYLYLENDREKSAKVDFKKGWTKADIEALKKSHQSEFGSLVKEKVEDLKKRVAQKKAAPAPTK